MPILPNSTNVGRMKTNGGQRTAVTMDGMADGMGAVADALDEQSVKRNNFQIAKARSEFLINKTNEDNAHDDKDHTEMEEAYSTGIKSHADNAASLITDPRIRNQFMLETNVDVARGTQQIRTKARKKEVDYELASFDDHMTKMREQIIAGGDVDTLTDAMELRIDTLYESDFISAQERMDFKQEAARSAITGLIETKEGKEQLALLDEYGAKGKGVLEPVWEAKQRKVSEQLKIDDEMMLYADTLFEKFSDDPNSAYKYVNDLTGAKERKTARIELDRRYKEKEVAEGEARFEVYSEVTDLLRDEAGFSLPQWRKSNPKAYAELLPNQKDDIERRYAEKVNPSGGGKRVTSRAVYDEFYNILNSGTDDAVPRARAHFVKNALKLSDTHFFTFSKLTNENQTPETKELFTLSHTLNSALKVAGVTSVQDRENIETQLQEWNRSFTNTNKRAPTGDEIRDKINGKDGLLAMAYTKGRNARNFELNGDIKKIMKSAKIEFEGEVGRPMTQSDKLVLTDFITTAQNNGQAFNSNQSILNAIAILKELGEFKEKPKPKEKKEKTSSAFKPTSRGNNI